MKGGKIRLELNNKQTALAKKHARVARHTYNWRLATCQAAYQNGEKRPLAIGLTKKLVAEVKSVDTWYYKVSKCTPQQALRNLNQAYIRYFKELGRFPEFKKKDTYDRFYLEGKIGLMNAKIKLFHFGWVKKNPLKKRVKSERIVIRLVEGRTTPGQV